MSEDPTLEYDLEEDFVRAADRWAPGLPLPLISGPELARYRELFRDGSLPAPRPENRVGIVLSTGGELARAVGAMLAAATNRPQVHMSPDAVLAELRRLAGHYVAVVGLADDLYNLDDWPGSTGAKVGLLTARTGSALTCLVYRSLTAHAIGEDRVFTVTHPLLARAEQADATTLAELDTIRGRQVKLLTLQAWGRECSSSLLDSVICGRSDQPGPEVVEVAPGQRRTSCLCGEGCFRTDIPDEARIPAYNINAMVIFTHSCRAADAGTNVFPTRITLTLGLLEGTAVAVIGALGMHNEQGTEQWTLESALAAHLPLGEVAHRLSTRSYPMQGEMTRFGLFGDPGQVLPWRPGFAGSMTAQPRVDEQAVGSLRYLHSTVLPRLERLRWFSRSPIDETALAAVRAEIQEAATDIVDPGLPAWAAALEDKVAALQENTLQRLADTIFTQRLPFLDHALPGLREVGVEPANCPQCRRPIGRIISMRHHVDDSLHVRTMQCRRCGDIWWSTEEGESTLHMRGAVEFDVSRSAPGWISREVENTGPRTVRGATGFAFSYRKIFGLPPGQVVGCSLGANEKRTVGFTVDTTNQPAQAEMHTTVFISLLDGIHIASTGMMRLA